MCRRETPIAYRPWGWSFQLSVCRCFASHLLLAVGSVAAFLLCSSGYFPGAGIRILLLIASVLPLLLVLFWSFCLARAVLARGIASPGRNLAVLLIPLIGIDSPALFAMILALLVNAAR